MVVSVQKKLQGGCDDALCNISNKMRSQRHRGGQAGRQDSEHRGVDERKSLNNKACRRSAADADYSDRHRGHTHIHTHDVGNTRARDRVGNDNKLLQQ